MCYKDLGDSLVFPEPEDFIRILSEREMVEFQPCAESLGWRVNFTIDMWPSWSLSRKYELNCLTKYNIFSSSAATNLSQYLHVAKLSNTLIFQPERSGQ